MAEEAGADDRTEEATSQRREDFRRRGQVVQSREVASVFLLFGSAIAAWVLGKFFLQQILDIFGSSFGDKMAMAARADSLFEIANLVSVKATFILGPMFGLLGILSFMSSVVQIGFIYNEDAVQLDFNRIDPLEGFRRVFSLRSLVEGVKSVFKLLLVGGIAYLIIRQDLLLSPLMVQWSASQILFQMGSTVFKLLLAIGVFMLVLAILDYGYLWWDLEKKMMMTKQEIKEEHKSREGDPLIKARIRKIQRELANKRMMADVPKAEVIITNPTHIAVALCYDTEMPAPKIVAIGADLVAEKIKKIATEHGIPLVENKPLARLIYKTLKVGHFIPKELFNAVAEVLAYVYKLKKKVMR